MQHPHPHPAPHARTHRRRRALLSAVTAAAALVGAGLTTPTTPDTSPTLELTRAGGAPMAATARQVEKLDRGVVSVHTEAGNLVSWRWLGTDPNDVSFNVYRAGALVNSTPVTGSTNYFHSGAPAQADYTVRAVVGGVEQADSVHAVQLRTGYKDVPIAPPAGGTKATPSLSGDILGDWREEVVWPTSDNTALRIYSTPVETSTKITTLLHDTMYRTALAWQNTAYNQPPHPSFFLGNGMATAPRPTVHTP